MITPDAIPVIPGLIIAAIAYVAWFALEIHNAPLDPDPELSRLDRMDGLGSRTD